MPTDEELANLAKALAHPLRVQIVRLLRQRNECVSTDLTAELQRSSTTVWQHLQILQEAGIVQGTISGPKMCYCLDPRALKWFAALLAELAGPDSSNCC